MLTSIQNPLVKEIRKLHQAKGRHQQELCLLEGTHLVEEACAASYPLITVCCTEEWSAQNPTLWEIVSQKAARLEFVSSRVLEALVTTINPDGIIATAPRTVTQDITLNSLGLALETVQDPGNLGTMIRTAAGAGAEGLWLSDDSVDLDHPKVLRASAGAWFKLPMAATFELKEKVLQCKHQGMQIVATLPDATLTYWQIDLKKPTLVLLGNEGAGLSVELTAVADQQIQVPLSRGIESLNVAIVAALILYEAQRQRSN